MNYENAWGKESYQKVYCPIVVYPAQEGIAFWPISVKTVDQGPIFEGFNFITNIFWRYLPNLDRACSLHCESSSVRQMLGLRIVDRFNDIFNWYSWTKRSSLDWRTWINTLQGRNIGRRLYSWLHCENWGKLTDSIFLQSSWAWVRDGRIWSQRGHLCHHRQWTTVVHTQLCSLTYRRQWLRSVEEASPSPSEVEVGLHGFYIFFDNMKYILNIGLHLLSMWCWSYLTTVAYPCVAVGILVPH